MDSTAEGHPPVDAPIAGAACRPNISGSGRRRRLRVGYVAVGITAVLWAALWVSHAHWYWRVLIGLPAALAAISLLQVRRNTCVARAAEGTFEHEDFSRTKMADADVAASRRVASGITRDAALIGVACAVLAALTAWV